MIPAAYPDSHKAPVQSLVQDRHHFKVSATGLNGGLFLNRQVTSPGTLVLEIRHPNIL